MRGPLRPRGEASPQRDRLYIERAACKMRLRPRLYSASCIERERLADLANATIILQGLPSTVREFACTGNQK
jgi:hypothetical protein